MNYNNIGIFMPPMIAWKWMKQRPQHIMAAFAKLGIKSAFITPQNRGEVEVIGYKEIEPNLFLCEDKQNMKFVLKKCSKIYMYTTWFMNCDYIAENPDVEIIYDIVDHVPFLSYYNQGGKVKHEKLLKKAAIVICTARNLLEEVVGERSDAIYIPNGVEPSDFEGDVDMKQDMMYISNFKKPIIGYYGALANWFDWILFNKVSELRPQYNFILIGCNYDGSVDKFLAKRPNVFHLGLKDYKDLYSYSKHFDVATVPFKINDITDACSPIKIFEYMAAGIPILSTKLKECLKYKQINIANDCEEYLKKLDYIIDSKEKEVMKDELIKESHKHSWASRTKQIIERIEI